MSQNARDLMELRRDAPSLPELQKFILAELQHLALNIIAPGVADMRGGC